MRLLVAIPRAVRQAATLRLLARWGFTPACSSSSHIHSQPKLDSRITGIPCPHVSKCSRRSSRSSCSSRCLQAILPSALRAVTALNRRWTSKPIAAAVRSVVYTAVSFLITKTGGQ